MTKVFTEVRIKVEVPQEDWIDFLTKHTDIFGRDYSGYWGRGLMKNKRGWLVWEFENDERPLPTGVGFIDRMSKQTENKFHREALHAFRYGKNLPPNYHVLGKAIAVKAYAEGVKRWGLDWFNERGDGNTYDLVLQLALLGEIRYG